MVIDGDFSCGVDIEKGGSSHVHPDFRVSENEKKKRPVIYKGLLYYYKLYNFIYIYLDNVCFLKDFWTTNTIFLIKAH